MQRIPYTYRRGATYYLRRRFSAPSGTFELHLSLRVKEQKTARPLSSRLTAASEEVIAKLVQGEMNKAEAEQYMISLIDEAASAPVRGHGTLTAQQREHAALCHGWTRYLIAIKGESASVTSDVAEAIIRYGGNQEVVQMVTKELQTEVAFALGGDFGYEIHARYMERALGRFLGAQESEVARQIELRSQAADAFWRAKQFQLFGSKLDELIAAVCDISGLFPHGRDIPFGNPRPPPFYVDQPIDVGDIFDEIEALAVTDPIDKLVEEFVASHAFMNVDRHPNQTALFETTMDRYRELQAQRASVASDQRSPSMTPLAVVDVSPPPINVLPQRPPSVSDDAEHFSGILDFATTLLERQVSKKEITQKTSSQTLQALSLFVEATGKTLIAQITQKDLARFKTVMLSLPPNYRKSPKDRAKSLDEIIAHAAALQISRAAHKGMPVKIGLSTQTINRNLTFVGKIIQHATAAGEDINLRLDPGLLRDRKMTRDNEDRPRFTRPDVERIFLHPVWQGQKTAANRNAPGSVIVEGALYWLPLLAVYSGCRLEELAGLKVDEIILSHDVPHLNIQINTNRRLKNTQSRRLVPIHPALLALGFQEYVNSVSKKGDDLFPEAKPSGQGTFGGTIDAPFRRIVEQQLGADARLNGVRKTFHSLRHYFAGELPLKTPEEQLVQKDILGHLHDSLTSETYGTLASLTLKALSMASVYEIDAIAKMKNGKSKLQVTSVAKHRPTIRLRQPRVKK